MRSSPPESARRAARPDDAEAVHAVMVAYERSYGGADEPSLEDVRDAWAAVDLARDAWVWERRGEVVAYAALVRRAERLDTDGYVHPEHRAHGFGAAIIDTAETRARERGLARLGNAVLAADEGAVELLGARGYRDVRHFYRMEIELDAPPPEPRWPDGLEARPFDREHAREFHAALDEAFAEEWGLRRETFEEWRERRLDSGRFDPTLWTAVWDGDEIAATLVADWKRFGAGWVGSVGVRKPWRRRGLGEALLMRAFGQFFERGERIVRLGVDAQNPTGATRLYERVGMHVVWEAIVFEKELVA